jgi:hypothetical protein
VTAQPGRDDAKQRKVSPALLVVLGVVALGAVVFAIVSGGGGPEQAAPAPTPTASSTVGAGGGASAPSGASPSPSPSSTPGAPTFELSEARDPFRPLVVPPAEGSTGAGGEVSPAPTPVASAGPGAGGAPAPAGGQEVELLDVVVDDQGTTRAQVKVGTTVSTVAAGETFASTYKLLSIQGACATMLNGDDNFTLCKGEQALK